MRQSLLSCSGVGWQRKVLKTKKKSPPRTFAVIVRNRVPSLLLAALRPELKQEKQLLERLSHKALKSYQHDGWDWGGHLWPHALSWHEVALAIACQFPPTPGFPIPLLARSSPSPGPPTWFLFLCLLPPRALLPSRCPRMLTAWQGDRERRNQFCPTSVAQSWGRTITRYCFPSKCSWLLILQGEKIVDSAPLGYLELRNNNNSNTKNNPPVTQKYRLTVRLWKCEPPAHSFGPKGTARESGLD